MATTTRETTGRAATVPVAALDEARSRDPVLVGAKAAALARARAAGLPALPGFVITTDAAGDFARGSASPSDTNAVQAAWRRLSDDGQLPLVVRSSSVAEDGASQSMAGMFTSVLDVRGWADFVAAASDVVASAGEAPMAVLVQPFLQPAWGGVLFGADPVTGRTDRLVLAAVPGGPDRLVSGEVDGVHATLSPRGRLHRHSDRLPVGLRHRRARSQLAALARRAAATFGGPQDIEWAIDDGNVLLLQSRPITALGPDARPTGPLLGPGPVAETFGVGVRALEDDLWVTPLRDGLREALSIVGVKSARQVRNSPVVVVVDGRVAADLDLVGLAERRRSLWSRLDPRPPGRRLKSAWRVGRLKIALPALAEDLLAEVDADLRSLPDLAMLTPDELLRLLRRSHRTLMALHGHEVLAGMLLADDDDRPTAAAAALRILASERAEGATSADDAELVARHPVLLSLIAPRIGGDIRLPATPAVSPAAAAIDDDRTPVREALRLRVRWVHEVTGRAALALGHVLAGRGALPTADAVADLRLDELAALTQSPGSLAVDLRERVVESAPLPATFRLSADGVVVPVVDGVATGGRGAGGGRASGPVHIGTDNPPEPGAVLVVTTLDPALAGVLPTLGGLVAETGSVLSHLAILAREYHVPTVVGLHGASTRFVEGAWVVVDGSTGEVTAVTNSEWEAA